MEKPTSQPTSPVDNEPGESIVIPVMEEDVQISKRAVDKAKVRIDRRVEVKERSLTDALLQEEVEVTRVPVNRAIETPPGIRQEGDEIIVPVLEEQLIVRKQLVLKEEVRIRRIVRSEPKTVKAEVREERVDVRRESYGEEYGKEQPSGDQARNHR